MRRAMRVVSLVAVALAFGMAWAAEEAEKPIVPTEKIDLFNGKDLTGWKLVAGAEPEKTFSVEDGVVKCTGRPAGYMRTEKDYKDYKFVMEWRFIKPGNTGVLVHMSGKDGVWPKSIECQGNSGTQGDFFVIGGTEFKEHKAVNEERKNAGKGETRQVPKKGPSNENKIGEWNTYEIICEGDTVRPYVNGKLMNEATECNVTSGKILIQSEGGQWEARKIYLEPLKK